MPCGPASPAKAIKAGICPKIGREMTSDGHRAVHRAGQKCIYSHSEEICKLPSD